MENFSKEVFIQRLQLVVEEFGITKKELAEQGGITQKTLANIFSGSSIPKADVLGGWAQNLGIDLHWLVFGEGQMHRDVQIQAESEISDPMAQRMAIFEKLMRKAGAPDKAIWEGLKAIAEGRADDHSTDQSGVEDGAA